MSADGCGAPPSARLSPRSQASLRGKALAAGIAVLTVAFGGWVCSGAVPPSKNDPTTKVAPFDSATARPRRAGAPGAAAPNAGPHNGVPPSGKAAPARSSEQGDAQDVDPRVLRALIADLGAAEYQRRLAATKRLEQLGPQAVPALVEAAESAVSLEVAIRAVEIVKRLYLGGDGEGFEQAEAALTKLSESPNRPVAAAAAEVLERFGDHVRLAHAVKQIERLGGSVKFSDVPAGFIAPGDLPLIQYVLIGTDWKGGDEGLKYVARLPTIGVVYLIRGAPVSEAAVQKLQQQRPDLRIQYRGRAYLGIASGASPGQGCLISQVQPGGAAAKAGLRAGDVILKFAGTPVEDFDQLVELIGKKAPGDKVDVVIRRNGQEMTIPVVLGTWK